MKSAPESKASPNPPQGIEHSHIRPIRWHKHANPASLLVIGALLLAALLGTFGGQPHPVRRIKSPAADIMIQLPEILRNGELFEMRATVTTRRPFDDLRLAVDASYWRDLMRLAGIARVEQVAWAILEPQGKISFVKSDGGDVTMGEAGENI